MANYKWEGVTLRELPTYDIKMKLYDPVNEGWYNINGITKYKSKAIKVDKTTADKLAVERGLLKVGKYDALVEITEYDYNGKYDITVPKYIVVRLSEVEDIDYISELVEELTEIDYNDWANIELIVKDYKVVG